MQPLLFTPLTLKSVTFRNRIFVSPMCQYSSIDGLPNDWHLVHLGSRATGGAGLVMVEATAVSLEGRISIGDLGIWNDEQLQKFKSITTFIKSQGSVPAIQIAHAGRKASCDVAWNGGHPLGPKAGGWPVVAPSPLPFNDLAPMPIALDVASLEKVKTDFIAAAVRAQEAGFEVLEIHMAHGYLLNEFLSPLTNVRQDQYGGSLENRMRFPLEVTKNIRKIWPEHLPLFVRISATDYAEGGWDLEQSLILSAELKKLGVDLIDTSSGGILSNIKISTAKLYQVPFATAIKQTGIMTGAVGLISEPIEANRILEDNEADVIFIGREFLRDPYWPIHAAKTLNVPAPIPKQYLRAF